MDPQRSWIRVSVRVDWKLILTLAILGVVTWLPVR